MSPALPPCAQAWGDRFPRPQVLDLTLGSEVVKVKDIGCALTLVHT